MAGCGVLRNREFFVCVAVIILVAASLELVEYLPVLPWASGNWTSGPDFALCHTRLHDLDWRLGRSESAAEELATPATIDVRWSWASNRSLEACQFQKMARDDVAELLRGKRVMVAGDSQARLFTLALLELQVPNVDTIRPELFKRHSGYKFVWEPENVVFDFVWAPYTENITEAVENASSQDELPDLIVIGAGLWHMLHVTNHTDYEEGLLQLREAIAATRQAALSIGSEVAETPDVPHVFWLNIASLIPPLLNTEDKRARMTQEMCWLYNEAVERSQILYPEGPATLIDLRQLSSGCGEECTEDGMHYNDAVYQAAVQIALNALKMSDRTVTHS